MTVGKWRKRYRDLGLEGLHDELRPGRPRTYEDDKVAEVAGRHTYQKLLVVSEVVRQQTILYHADSRSIPDRIVSLSKAHIRPIVRGKARCNVEF
jgi:transposase